VVEIKNILCLIEYN